jgi:hypothetical protein
MWLDAVVTTADFQKVADQLAPATVPLGDRGHLFFDAPADVSLVAERGLRVRCHAKLKWPVLGIEVGVTVRSMTVLIVPSVESRDGEQVIVFSPEVDALDLALLPDIGDDELRAFINRALQEKRIELPWKYKQTLDHQLAMPEWFRAGAIFDIQSNGAAVKVTNDSVGLAIGLSASIEATPGTERESPTDERPPPHRAERNGHELRNGTWSPPSMPSRSVALATRRRRARFWGLGLAVASGFGIGCLVGLGRARR